MESLTKPTFIVKNRTLQSITLETQGDVLDAYEFGCKCSDTWIDNKNNKLLLIIKPPSDSELMRVRTFVIKTPTQEISHPVYWTVINDDKTYINGNIRYKS